MYESKVILHQMRPLSVQVQFSKQQERKILHSKIKAFKTETQTN